MDHSSDIGDYHPEHQALLTQTFFHEFDENPESKFLKSSVVSRRSEWQMDRAELNVLREEKKEWDAARTAMKEAIDSLKLENSYLEQTMVDSGIVSPSVEFWSLKKK